MANWAYALSQGAAQMAGAGADIADRQLKEEAEMRAADRKLSDAERLLAIQDAMKNRAAERFSGVVRNKAGEEVPMEAAPVTELTEGSAKLAGLQDGIQGDNAVVGDIVTRAKQTLANPNATAEQKQQARELIEQIAGQVQAQGDINAKAVEGKTRKRTWNEAVDAAREETLMTDAPAFIAGEGMLSADRKEKSDERKEGIALERLKLQERMKQAEIEQRDRSDDKKFEATMARFEAQIQNAQKSGNKQLEQQYAISLRTEINSVDREIREMERNKKDKFDDEKKEIDEQIALRRDERRQLVQMQNQYFKEAGINVAERPEDRSAAASKPPTRLTFDPATGKFK